MSNLEMMESILAYRKSDNTFEKSIKKRNEAMTYKFFDGPPFASGNPHYGHLLAGSIKDTIPRYMTMRGYQVKRKRGWDCHGLPVEKAVEKELGIDGKKDIEEKIGIQTFVEKCREYVNQTNTEWKRFVDHTGRWVDITNPYFTMDLDFMESVMRCFSNIYNQNKVYKGFKVQGYCPSCATALANNEIVEGYEDRQDTALTVKFPHLAPESEKYSCSEDGFIDVVAGVLRDEKGRYAMIHHTKENLWFFPGGKVEKGEDLTTALKRELKEEIGTELTTSKYLGAVKIIHLSKPRRVHRFEVESNDLPTLQEPEKHKDIQWVTEELYENSLGSAININGTIINDERELLHDFIDFYLFKKVLNPQEKGLIEGKFNFLAWTTTPWTLPSNMFLTIGENIDYVTVYDQKSQEYYVLAEALLKKYYKSAEDYTFIYKQKGKELKNLTYQPLFDYIKKSNIADEYKSQFFQILTGEFVSTEDGTGIVHTAPSFGEDDFNAVANLLGGETSKKWLFMPVDEYGCFTSEVPDYQGMKVMESNKPITEHLKAAQKIVKTESLVHSYPHCRRCKTPLIYKAMSSRFIKEKEMNAQTASQAGEIKFIPETVKNRFVNGLQQAPDWNVARNRYRGSPLPIWQNVENPEDRFVINTLDELYHLTTSGSKNLTKNVFIRHGRTDFNEEKKFDSLGDARLNELGEQQAQGLVSKLAPHIEKKSDVVFILSPLPRVWQTIKPTLIRFFGADEVARCEKLYFEHHESHKDRFEKRATFDHVHNGAAEEIVVKLNDQLFIDSRITDLINYTDQGEKISCDMFNRFDEERSIGTDGEKLQDYRKRTESAIRYWNSNHQTKTLVYVSHDDTIAMLRRAFRKFEYGLYRKNYKLGNAEVRVHYRDSDKQGEVDLHKPYVDTYRGIREGKTYKRTPEVLDCWFESGAMPFGQDHYLGEEGRNISYPADFIAEGLDQTRGRFRSLHVVGHAIKGENAYKNVIVNGLVLAEDGKKMSKSLKNYPDPKELIEKWGADAFRLYTLSSPVVRSEPMRFSEKGVEQLFKDFNIPLENVFKFFETYAKIDNWKANSKELYMMNKLSSDEKTLQENLIRIQPDIIYIESHLSEQKQKLSELVSAFLGKKPEIKILDQTLENYLELVSSLENQRTLIIADETQIKELWSQVSSKQITENIVEGEVLKFPNYTICNELDRWILAELHQTLDNLDQGLRNYNLDGAIKSGIDFIEKLSNRYLRRSRRRFRGHDMTADKHSAYSTLFEVLTTYLQMMAPFTPFITEDLRKRLQAFRGEENQRTESIHLSFWPFTNKLYIDCDLMDEITTVRKAIKLALFIRSKNKIAVKQPLKSLSIRIE
ncbi:MAG: class I tRNA ligase family protein [candidate division SR1 bacterium]|nr:class I tRNA ligase family protein [candidate division SR1 bacterium]